MTEGPLATKPLTAQLRSMNPKHAAQPRAHRWYTKHPWPSGWTNPPPQTGSGSPSARQGGTGPTPPGTPRTDRCRAHFFATHLRSLPRSVRWGRDFVRPSFAWGAGLSRHSKTKYFGLKRDPFTAFMAVLHQVLPNTVTFFQQFQLFFCNPE